MWTLHFQIDVLRMVLSFMVTRLSLLIQSVDWFTKVIFLIQCDWFFTVAMFFESFLFDYTAHIMKWTPCLMSGIIYELVIWSLLCYFLIFMKRVNKTLVLNILCLFVWSFAFVLVHIVYNVGFMEYFFLFIALIFGVLFWF